MIRYHSTIGLDVSDGVAKLVFARRRWGALEIDAVHSIPLSGNPEEDAEILRGVFEKNAWFDTPCVVGLRGESLMLRVVECPGRDRKSMHAFVAEQMVHFESLANSPTVTEYVLAKPRGAPAVVVVGMARMDTVLAQIDSARQIGATVVDLVPGPLALYNAVSYFLPWNPLPIVCVDIGRDSTQVVIGEGRSIAFARRFLMGFDLLEGSGSCESRQPELFGSEKNAEGGLVLQSESSGFQDWLAELQGCLKFYTGRLKSSKRTIGKIVLCGKADMRDEWIQSVQSATGVETVSVASLPRAGQLQGDAALVAAVGFALAGLGREKVTLSMLPPTMKEVYTLGWQIKYWLLAGLGLILGVLLITLRMRGDVLDDAARLHAKNAELVRMEALEDQLYSLQLKNEELDWQLVSLRAAVDNGHLFEAVLAAVSEAKHSGDWITLIAESSSYFQDGIRSPRGAGTATREGVVAQQPPIERFAKFVLEGRTPLDDLSTVRAMIEKLRTHPLIDAVDLLPDDKVRPRPDSEDKWIGYSKTRFAIEVSVVRP